MSEENLPADEQQKHAVASKSKAPAGNDGASATDPSGPLTPEQEKKLVELDEAIVKFEQQKRWSDLIKTTLAKAELIRDVGAKVELFSSAGRMYLERSSNQAEAIKCYQRVLDYEPLHPEAIEQLKGMYEKRRDWERLIEVMGRELDLLAPSEHAARRLEMAKLANERVRKPEVCIVLWQGVLDSDPDQPDAIAALAQLYERAREWKLLAAVLERQSEQVTSNAELLPVLQKLGLIYGDKLQDDDGAARAFQRVLEIDPEDRRAQEQLKKRYVALRAWDDLEAFYGRTGQWEELIRTLERAAETDEAAGGDRIPLLFRVAVLWKDRVGKLDRAARAYEKILTLDAKSLEAAEALSPIYEQAGDAKKLVGTYEVRLEHVEDAEERVKLLRQVGLLYEDKLRNLPVAFERFLDAFSTAPMDPAAREDVERLATKLKDWSKVFEAYAGAIERSTVSDEAHDLRLHYGRVLLDAGRVDDAIAAYRAVYDDRTEDPTAIEALERLYREHGRHLDLLGVLQRRAEIESDAGVRKRLAYDIAALYRDHLKRGKDAIEVYRNLIAEFGDDEADAYRALDALFEAEERWDDMAESLERRIDLGPASDEELASLKFRLANTLRAHMGDGLRALDLYREVLTILPEHSGALDALEALLADRELGAQAAAILEPVYEGAAQWGKLIHALEASLASVSDPAQRIDVITKAGELYAERVGDAEKAFDSYGRAFREAPGNPGVAARLEELAGQANRYPALAELVAQLAGKADDPELARNLWAKAGALREGPLNDTSGAVEAYLQALEQAPGDLEILEALEALYGRTERWSDLLDVLRKKVQELTEPAAQQEVLVRMAEILEGRLSQPEAAIRVYGEILELDPTHTPALAALDGLYERLGRWSELADNVGRQLSLAEDEDRRTQLMFKLADLRETRMNQVDAAIEMYREILERDPNCAPAIGAMERLLANEAQQVRIAEILEPLYRESNDFQKLIGVHEIQVKHSDSPDRRVELLHGMAQLHEVALDDTAGAFACLARALAEDPGNLTTQQELERVAASAGTWRDLAETYEKRLEGIEDASLAVALHVKAAELRETRLGDVEGAIGHYRRVIERDDHNLDAASALERLYQASERYDDLARIYLVKAGMLDVPAEQRAYYFRAGAIYEDILDRPKEAVGVYRQSLTVEPDDLEALDKLTGLYLRLEDWESLLGVYGQRADIVDDPEQKKGLLAEVGAVYEQRLSAPDKAIEVYQRVLDIDPDDLQALARLDALYGARHDWEALLGVLEREADRALTPEEALDFRHRIGELHERRLNDGERAVGVYREILEVNPDHEATLGSLERMISEGKEPVAAAEVLEPIYRGSGESAKLAGALEVLVKHEPDPIRSVELLHQVAELHEVHLDQARAAFDAYARSLPHDNGNSKTLEAMERLADGLQAWPEVARLYDLEVQRLKAESPERAIDLALRLARIFEVQVGDVDQAIARYRIVFDVDPTHAEALEALDRLYQSTERWAELAEVLRQEAEVAGSPAQVLDHQFRLGQVYEHRLGNVERAVDQYREIVSAAPEYQAALIALQGLFERGVQPKVIGEILEPLYRMQGAWDGLIIVHERQLASEADPAERVAMMHRVAELAERKLDDPALAFVWMQRAYLEDPSHDHTASETDRLAGMVDGWRVLASTCAQVLDGKHDKERLVAAGTRLARIYEEELGDVARAEEALRLVLAIDDKDQGVLAALDRIYTENGAGPALAEVLRKRVAVAEDTLDKAELSHRLGATLYDDCGCIEEAIAVFRDILENQDPRHEETIRALQNAYVVTENWEKLYEAYEKELDVVVGDSSQAEILGRMAVLAWTRLHDLTRAVDLLKRVLDLLGEDPAALNALGNIYAVQENWMDLVDVLEREVAVSDDEQMKLKIYGDLGRIWSGKLRRDRNALESWERALDIDPGHTDALFAIADIHRTADATSDLIDTLHRIIDVGAATLEDAVIEGVYVQLGTIYEGKLQQPTDAVEAYRQALELNPRNFPVMDSLERIHAAEGQWEECIEIKSKRVEALEESSRKIAVLLEMASTLEEKLDAPDRVTEPLHKVLAIEPLHAYAFEKLETLYRERERFVELIDLYVARVEATTDIGQRVALLRKVARVNEKDLGDKNQAFEALQLAWTQDFTSEETAAELERITGLTQRWNELLTTANQSLQEVREGDLEVKHAICLKCARWYAREGHPEYAIPYLQQVLANDAVHLPAMKQMADLYRETQQWQVYAQALRKLSEITEDPKERAEVYVRMGELNEGQFALPDQAIKHYNDALSVAPSHLGALKALERMHRARGEWPDLIRVLRRKVDAVSGTEDALAAKLELAEAYEDRVADKNQAIEQYRAVLEDDAQNLQALKGLERLYSQLERWQELLGVLERQLDLVVAERDQIALRVRIAGMWEEEFLKPEKAAERLEQVIELDPTYIDALKGLERIYRQLKRWNDLVAVYQRHVDATPDRRERAELFKGIGGVHRDELDDSASAVEAFVNVTAIDPDDRDALSALADLYEKRDEHSMALDAMDKLAERVTVPADRVALFYRMGRIYDRQIGDRVTAVEQFQKAIDIDSRHIPSLEAMRDIHVDEGDWHAAARVLEQATEVETNPRKNAALRVELARIFADRLDERERAIECFQEAIKLDADNADAARPLVDEYVKQERWRDAEPLLRMLVRNADVRDTAERHRYWYLYGQTSEKTQDYETAARAYGQAFQLDAQDLPSLMGLAGAHYQRKDWDEAHKYYQMALVHHRDALGVSETTDTFYRLGVIKREQGEPKKALNMFDKALEEDSIHRPTLEALVALYLQEKDHEQAIHYKKRLLDCAEDDAERFRLYDEIGELWQKELKNPAKAIDAFFEASMLQPRDHRMLHKLLGLYQQTGQWERAIEVIDRISELEERAEAKAKYAYTVGIVLRDELKDPDAALERFNQALDLDAKGMLKSFESINKILTQKKDWKELERAFRKMLHRIAGKGDPSLEFNLWHNLGVIYRDRLRSLQSAAEAFAMASRVEPENVQEHQILAEIYALIPGRLPDAVAEHRTLLTSDPYREDSYRSLYRLYLDAREYDKAWCVAATLAYLKKVDREQKQFYEQYRTEGPIRPRSRLNNERWVKDLFHPEEDFLVGKLFEAVTPAVLRIKAQPDAKWQLKKKDLIPDPMNTTVTFARTFGFASQVLALPFTPRLFVCPDRQGGIAYAATQPPASVCGNSLLSGVSPLDVMFIVAKHLTYYRGEHYIRTMFQTKDEMKMVLLAAMQIAGVATGDAAVDQWAKQIRSNMQPADMELLNSIGKRFVDAGARTDIKKWMRMVELTACRTGFLLANDLGIAARMIQAEPPMGAVDLTPKEKIDEMVRFSVSDEYFRLREALGIQVQVA